MQSFRGYGNVADQDRSDSQKKKRFTIIGVCSIILVAMVVAVTVGVSRNQHTGADNNNKDNSGDYQTSMKAITSLCQPTDYRDACIKSLSSVAKNGTSDPKDLVKLAFKVAIDHIKKAFQHSKVLKEIEKDPRTTQALENCQELLNYAVDDLQNSFHQLGEFDLSKLQAMIDDLKIWLSASITYQETCLDGFQNTTGHAGESMRKALKSGQELTSNTLAIVSEVSSFLSSFKIPLFNRRLLSAADNDGYPFWVSGGKRRLLHQTPGNIVPNVVVAKDGSGHFTTINEAIKTIPLKSNKTYVIYIKEGVYKEMVQIDRSMMNVMMIGDGPTKTKITGNKNFVDGTPTFKTATVAVIGDGFIAKNIGFENSAGAAKHQAVALRVQSDMSIFYNCQMDGYQDTLYAHTHRQFYRECTISGTIDFIFGDSAVVFQNCLIVVRKPLDNQQNTITAQGRKDRREPTALILHNCTVVGNPAYYPLRNTLPTYLGRPWKEYSRTFIFQTNIGDIVQPAGWMPWMGDFALNTCFYAEFNNRGPGSVLKERVKWRGIKTITAQHAEMFTVSHFIHGDKWIKASGVPYTPGLLPIS